jgi:predicted Fe-Mo cluster-binding NifX family protein
MKIAVPANETSSDTGPSVSFGRSPSFMLYDSETMNYTSIINPGNDASGGAGIKAAQAVVDAGAQVVITFRCGENAAKVLSSAGITVYTAGTGSIAENVTQCIAGKLPVLQDIHSGFHHQGDNH